MTRGEFTRKAILMGGGALIWLPASGHEGHGPARWIVPQVRIRPQPLPGELSVSKIESSIQVRGQVATTEMILTFKNPTRHNLEGKALLPVPVDATLKSFSMEGGSVTTEAKLLPREEARRIYDEIVRSLKDPAILEFAGLGAVKTGVFPVPAGKEVRLRLVYEELLVAEGDRLDFTLPRSEAMTKGGPSWSISLDWKDARGIRTLYSPSHEISLKRHSAKRVSFRLEGEFSSGSLQVSVLTKSSARAVASVLSHAENGEEGYFLMLISPPAPSKDAPRLKREVTLVIDRSGSMAGEKLKQARAAAVQVLGGLEDGELFNLMVYNEAIESFAPGPVELNEKTREQADSFLRKFRVSGGTNIYGALTEALSQPLREGFMPMVLFLTDGLPTIGETSEKKIRASTAKLNKGQRRLFTFGVGVDVNTPLLSRLADDSRAMATYVLPKEDVELKVAGVFRRLSGPVLGAPKLAVPGDPGRISDMLPSQLPDFYEQDQIVVLGRYHGNDALKFVLEGDDGAGPQKYTFDFKPKPGKRLNVIPRLWATRKIAVLTEALRDLGADSAMQGLTGNAPGSSDPRFRELVDEIVRLSTEHGILTEYTAFLAREGEVFNSRRQQNEIAAENFAGRALEKRSGAGGVNQEMNLWKSKAAGNVDKQNRYVNSDLQEEAITKVQQVGRKTFYEKGGAWVDAEAASAPVAQVIPIEIGSPEFFKLVDRLVALEQQSALALGSKTHLVIDGKLYQLR
ncbi:VIT and VWA domain-containing protein [Verrucomicrobiaceae bacterium 227]